MPTTKKPRGFAAMSLERRRAIARLGGLKTSHGPKGRARMSERGKKGAAATAKLYKVVPRNR